MRLIPNVIRIASLAALAVFIQAHHALGQSRSAPRMFTVDAYCLPWGSVSAVPSTTTSVIESAAANHHVYEFQIDRTIGAGVDLERVVAEERATRASKHQLPPVADVQLVFIVHLEGRKDKLSFGHGSPNMLVNGESMALYKPLLRGLAKFLPYYLAIRILDDPKIHVDE